MIEKQDKFTGNYIYSKKKIIIYELNLYNVIFLFVDYP